MFSCFNILHTIFNIQLNISDINLALLIKTIDAYFQEYSPFHLLSGKLKTEVFFVVRGKGQVVIRLKSLFCGYLKGTVSLF